MSLPTRFPLFVAATAATFLTFIAAVGPAMAAEPVCTQLPQDLRVAVSQSEDAKAANAALRKIETGEALCDAGNERAAKKQFSRAIKTLGLDETELAALAVR